MPPRRSSPSPAHTLLSCSRSTSSPPSTVVMSPLYQAPVVSDTTFIEVGWALLSRQGYHRRMSIRRYKAHFGIVPGVCADIWAMINPREEISPYAKPVHLLWGLMLMKVYSTEEVLSGIAGVTEKTYRKWAWTFIRATSDLSYSVVSSSSYDASSPRLHFTNTLQRFGSNIGSTMMLGTSSSSPSMAPTAASTSRAKVASIPGGTATSSMAPGYGTASTSGRATSAGSTGRSRPVPARTRRYSRKA